MLRGQYLSVKSLASEYPASFTKKNPVSLGGLASTAQSSFQLEQCLNFHGLGQILDIVQGSTDINNLTDLAENILTIFLRQYKYPIH